ncbi:MAG: aldo/keto reductase [Clostridiales bacterium]|nr:aldo/keto reductase [Clostridiales bacterium]
MDKKLGFGFMRLPLLDKDNQTSFDYDKLNSLVDMFIERGFTYFDTALTYHGGKSEEALRKSVIERYPRDKFTVATKLPPRVLKSYDDQEIIFNKQLERCGVDYFDYYLIHNIGESAYKQAKEFKTFEFTAEKKKQGKIKNVGMSFHDKPELLDDILTAHPELDFVQLQINYMDWENPAIQSRQCYEIARKHNMSIIVMELCKGGNLAAVPERAEKLMKSAEPNMSVPSWTIRFAAGLDGVMMVLSGMNAIEQMEDNTSFMTDFKPLSEEEIEITKKAAEIINEENSVPCTGCRYCIDGCPMNIAIPECFSLYNNSKRPNMVSNSSHNVYYLNLITKNGRAGDCIGCGQCESVCPQHIDIIDRLKDVSEIFDSVPPLSTKVPD